MHEPFNNKESFETHFQHCIRGKAKVEEMPKHRDYKYVVSGNELSPLRVVYADAECYIEPETKTHMPGAIGVYDVWHVGSDEE